jgi:general stress protein 26
MNYEKRLILDFLRGHVLCTISTVNNKTLQPESALVAYAELASLEILVLTLRGSRKYINLQENNKVALVIGWDENPKKWATLKYEGCVFQVADADEPKYKRIFLEKKGTPCTEEFFNKPDMKLFKITPTWIGLSRFRGKPQVIGIKF